MSNETINILPDCVTELPKQFKTWIDFYNFIKKDGNGQADIVYFKEYPHVAGEKTRITKYLMIYIKSKCFDEQENLKATLFECRRHELCISN